MGGFYCSDITVSKVRHAWWTINSIILLYIIFFNSFGFILTTKIIHLPDLLYVFVVLSGFLYSQVFIPLVTFSFSDGLKIIMKDLDDEFNCHEPKTVKMSVQQAKHDKHDSASFLTSLLTGLCTVGIIFLLSNFVYLVLACGTECVSNQSFYLLGTPLVEYVSSIKVYLGICVVHSIFIVIALAQLDTAVVFGLVTGYEFYNIFVNLSLHTGNFIDDTVQNLRLVNRISKANKDETSEENDAELYERFKVGLASIGIRHQKLYR